MNAWGLGAAPAHEAPALKKLRRSLADALKATEEATKRQLRALDDKARELLDGAAAAAREGVAALDASRAAEAETTAHLSRKLAAARTAAAGSAELAEAAAAAEKSAKAGARDAKGALEKAAQASAALRRRLKA